MKKLISIILIILLCYSCKIPLPITHNTFKNLDEKGKNDFLYEQLEQQNTNTYWNSINIILILLPPLFYSYD